RANSCDDENRVILDDRGALRPPRIGPLTRIAAPGVRNERTQCATVPASSSKTRIETKRIRARESAHAAR
ncbi:hypothetical protein, partial [Burkholderia pseudomallei]|uniref:hypothetical protein n=1 Tax=Burkholderia pseudomallei TaxID=28450 RepID=UPI001CA51A77